MAGNALLAVWGEFQLEDAKKEVRNGAHAPRC
jgi:hypothetical protein